MDGDPTYRDALAAEAAEYLRERAEAWGAGFSVDPDAIVMRGRGKNSRPPKEATFLRKMVIFEARKEGFSRDQIADALGLDRETVRRHERDAEARWIEVVREREVHARFPVLVDGRLSEHVIYTDEIREPTDQFFKDLRRSAEQAIKYAGKRQANRRRAAIMAAAKAAARKSGA